MPTSVVAAVIGAAVGEYVAAQFAVAALLGEFLTAAVVRGVVGAIVGGVVTSALRGSAGGAGPTPAIQARDRLLTIRQSIAPWQIIYGRARVGGTLTYVYENSGILWMVITLAGHVCEEIGDIYLDDEVVTLDVDGLVTSGRYANYVRIKKSLGTEAGQPFPDLITDTGGEWTDAHRQTGRTKILIGMSANRDVFASGVPNVTAIVKGRKVQDPRVSPSGSAWSANAALCLADYLSNSEFGVGADFATEFDTDTLVAAANACDEQVALAGSPTVYENRYELNGAFRVDAAPKDIISQMLASMAGKAVNAGGKWHIFAGAYEAPTLTFDEGDLAGPIKVQSLLSRRDNCNAVKGIFTDPNSHWQPTDFPALASNSYMAEDNNERVWRDLDFSAFVTSGTQAQRLAKIELLSVRQGLSVSATFKLKAWAAMTGRTIALDNTRFGWSGKAFEVVGSRFIVVAGGVLSVELQLRETAAAVFDWATSEEQSVDIAPNSSLPDPFTNLGITGLTASSGTADLFRQGDGTIVPRVRLRWTEPSNPFISTYEIQLDRGSVSPTEWGDCPKVLAPATEGFAVPVKDGEAVNLRIRARTSIGNAGDWAYVYGHTVIGKTAAPSDVVNPVAFQNGDVVVFGCDAVTDPDLDYVQVRWGDLGETMWENGIPVANILRGQQLPSASIPQGSWTFMYKAYDTSGNPSNNVASVNLSVTADGYTSIASREDSPGWPGTLDGFIVSISGALVPLSIKAANLHTKAELWEQYVPYPVAVSTYTAPEIDKGIDATVRVYANIVSVLGRGETSGVAAPVHQVDMKTSAGAYDGFEDWSVGSANFRYLKSRIYSDNTLGKIKITGFATTIDARTRTEDGTYTTPAGGSVAVTFTNPFHSAPGLVVSPQGSGDVSASYQAVTGTGFTGYFKSAGAAAAGTASYKATGA